MNLNFNHFAVTDKAAAKTLRKYIVRNECARNVERLLLGAVIYICGKVIVAQHNEIEKLRKESENSKKGD